MENYNRRTGVSNLVSNWNRVQPTIVAETTTNGTTWTSLAPTRDGDYNVLTFTDTWTTPGEGDGRISIRNGPLLVEYLVVGGGGKGGATGTTDSAGGGGGGGGVAYGFMVMSPSASFADYQIGVGSGGTSTTTRGGTSFIKRVEDGSYPVRVEGGGGAGGNTSDAQIGGCGGGPKNGSGLGSFSVASGYFGSSAGNATNSNGGGGGGASGAPSPSSFNGGPGFTSSISGTSVVYGSGGGGGGVGVTAGGTASSGAGAGGSNGPGGAGTNGQGGGGGGGGRDTGGPYGGGDGGSGIVILRWRARATDVNGVSQRDLVSGWQAVPGTIIGETTTNGISFSPLTPTRVGADYVLTFTNTRSSSVDRTLMGRFTVVAQPVLIRYLLVAGGGAGGKSGSTDSGGGGGGGGGVIERQYLVQPGVYNVGVGRGGVNAAATTGATGTMIFPVVTGGFGPVGPGGDDSAIAYVRGGAQGSNDGQAQSTAGAGPLGGLASGGGTSSLGGGAQTSQPTGQWWTYAGYSNLGSYGGGGGGGAAGLQSDGNDTALIIDPLTGVSRPDPGTVSSAGGNGVTGWSSDITGTTVVYGSGGGGGGDGLGAGGTAGTGGGNGGSNAAGANATNAGGGGGGGGRDTLGPYNGGNGAAGILIIRWSVV